MKDKLHTGRKVCIFNMYNEESLSIEIIQRNPTDRAGTNIPIEKYRGKYRSRHFIEKKTYMANKRKDIYNFTYSEVNTDRAHNGIPFYIHLTDEI